MTPWGADPGWPSIGEFVRALPGMLVPGVGIRRQLRRSASGVHGLLVLRLLFVAFVAMLLIVSAVLVLAYTAGSYEKDTSVGLAFAVVLVAMGVFSFRFVSDLGLSCVSDASLARSYSSRLFVAVAFSGAMALVGIIGFGVSRQWWVGALGGAFTVVGYARVAPTARHLAQDQRHLSQAGCDRSLIEALRHIPST